MKVRCIPVDLSCYMLQVRRDGKSSNEGSSVHASKSTPFVVEDFRTYVILYFVSTVFVSRWGPGKMTSAYRLFGLWFSSNVTSTEI